MNPGKNVLGLFCLLFVFITIFSGCSESDKAEEKPQSILLSVDKDLLKSDGNEIVTFSIIADGKDVSFDIEAEIIYKEENLTLSGKTFSTNIPGTHSFYATYKGVTSPNVQINAMPIVLVLSADTTSLKANGKSFITFSATADDKNVTGDVEFFYKSDDVETILENNIFITEKAGTYEFYCRYKEQLSNAISITAVPFILTLTSDKASIKANGSESVIFTVMADEEDVTDEATLYRKEGEHNIQLEDKFFATDKEGDYDFFVQYKEQVSNTLSIEAIISRLSVSVDKTAIKTGESVTFTAISDDVNDVSSSVTLHIACNGNEEILNNHIFTPASFGTYSIYATYEERTSNIIEIEVIPANVTLSVDRDVLMSTGVDMAMFAVFADGVQVDNAEIFMKREPEDAKLSGYQFSTNLPGTYTFYTQYAGTRSEDVGITVYLAHFFKQSCAMEIVATWCGYSPQMISAFHQVKEQYSDHIHIVSLHRSTSELGSTDVDADGLLEHYNRTGIPFGIMDFDDILLRSASEIQKSYEFMKVNHPATSGVAIVSEKTDNYINVTLNVKVNETNEYSVYAFIVEDNVIKSQVTYINNSKDNAVWNDNYVHHAVATFAMPGVKPYTGKYLGTIPNGEEVYARFSIPLDKTVTNRTINYSNCRVVAYVLKKSGNQYYINNAATCPVHGSVDYKYED